jgi:hypothetical protein
LFDAGVYVDAADWRSVHGTPISRTRLPPPITAPIVEPPRPRRTIPRWLKIALPVLLALVIAVTVVARHRNARQPTESSKRVEPR